MKFSEERGSGEGAGGGFPPAMGIGPQEVRGIPRPERREPITRMGVTGRFAERARLESSRFLFNDLVEETRNARASAYVMLRFLLHSRIGPAERPGETDPQEDIDGYLAGLLRAFDDPASLETAASTLARYDHEAFGRLSRSAQGRLTYRIHRTTTDFLLVSIGIFDDPGHAYTQRVPAWQGAKRSLDPTEEAAVSRGRNSYLFIYQYNQLLSTRQPVLNGVLDRLSRGLDRYTRVLAHLRGEYLDLAETLSRGETFHLERSVDAQDRQEKLSDRRDAFLDAYSRWRRDPTEAARAALDAAVDALQSVDPGFRFEAHAEDPWERPAPRRAGGRGLP